MINPIKLGQNIMQAKKQYDEFQSKMRDIRVTGESKNGLVKVVVNGLKEVIDVNISDELLTDKEVLQRHIKDAFNDAGKKLEKDAAKFIDKDQAIDMLKKLMG